MVVVCWSVKGGVGTTVVAAALALAATRRVQPTVVYRWGRPGVYGGCGRQGAA